jgi:16S rRNA (cytosine967-C5)-methyltransferase
VDCGSTKFAASSRALIDDPQSEIRDPQSTDSATLNHAARVLGSIAPDLPADAALRRYLYAAKRLGGREKRAISRAVFTYFRWWRWLDPKSSLQKQVAEASALQKRFDADERSIKPEALAAKAVPDWLRDEMELPAGYLRQLQREPALWLRARPGTAAKLARELGNCESSPFPVSSPELEVSRSGNPTQNPKRKTQNHVAHATAPDALRYTGTNDLFLTPAFHNGAFEIQDLASQLVGHACAPHPGETWWDACAGEGGKLLHLADLMANKGVIWATDRNERRLHVLKRRAARAQIFNFRTAGWDGSAKPPTKTKFDGILVDAPCSGVGTWQRNPHARWTVSPQDVRELAATQLALLNHVAGSLKPHGRIVYSVCTLTRSETEAVASAFTAAHPELEPLPLFNSSRSAIVDAQPGNLSQLSSLNSRLLIWPHELNANGMFIAAWKSVR